MVNSEQVGFEMEVISRQEAKARGLKYYFTGVPCKRGHIAERNIYGSCVTCQKEYWQRPEVKAAKKEYKKKYWQRPEVKAAKKEYWHRPEVKAAKKEYKQKPERKAANKSYQKAYNQRPEVKAAKKEYCHRPERKAAKRAYRKRPVAKLDRSIRTLLNRVLERTGTIKSRRTEKLIGYSRNQLTRHLEKQFLKGMTWQNRDQWHIDHIIPVSKFIEDGVTDPAVINALPNLRPIWASDNLSKSNKVETLL